MRRRLLLSAMAASVAPAGLLQPGSAAAATPDGLTVALPSDVATMDPTIDNALVSFPVRLNVFNALTEIGPDGTLEPRLATSWSASGDGRVWTFQIRAGAKFHDGQPVTVDDVIFSFQKIMDDKTSPVRSYLISVVSVERVAEDSVRFQLTDPYALWARQVMTIAIVPRAAYQKMGAKQFGLTPIGSGPYRMVRWIKDDRIELEAFPDYWGGAPKIKSVVLRPIASEPVRATALLTGEVDIVPSLAPGQIRLLTGKPNVVVKSAPSFKVVYLGFNVSNPALKDVRMRQAIDMAIDRTAITTKLLRGSGTPIGQIVSPAHFGYDPTIKPTTYNPDRARQLVKESGYNGEPIPFQFNGDFIVSGNDVAQAVLGYLQAVGINTKSEVLDYNGFISLWTARKMPGIHMFVWGGVLMDADTQIMTIYATSGARGYIFNDQVDALALQQRAAVDPEKRRALISKIWALSNEYVPFSYLYNEQQEYGLRTGIDWTPSPDGLVRLTSVAMKG